MNYSDFVLSWDELKSNASSLWCKSITDPQSDGPKQGLRIGCKILELLKVGGAFIKTSYDTPETKNCGNTSVAQSVADSYFANLKATQECDEDIELQVKIVNSGSNGDKIYIYGHIPSENITYILDEVRTDKDDPIASPHLLKVGTYCPKNPVPVEELRERSKLLLEKSYPNLTTLILITGPLRVHFFKSDESEQKYIYSVMRDQLFCGKNMHPIGQYFITQEEEALYELKSTCNMYSNLTKRGLLKPIKIIGAIGIGGSSSQLSIFVPRVPFEESDEESDEESEKEKIYTICFPYGMSNPKELKKFPQYAYEKLKEIEFLQTLEDYSKQGLQVAFAMKSGTALLFDNFQHVLQAANLHKVVVKEVQKFTELLHDFPDIQKTQNGKFQPMIESRFKATFGLLQDLRKISMHPYHDNETIDYVQHLMKKTKCKCDKLEDLLRQATRVEVAKKESVNACMYSEKLKK